ncbi:MAG TPA: adenylate/guanylate cyclase domain-containing protein [Hyphomicrobiales bacterium]|nr:adenylate/guanylate cyclase domain-containing protein [Hyphomicrobiales bacterium]
MAASQRRRRTGLAAAVAAAALALVTLLRTADPAFLADVRARTFDAYERLAPRPYDPRLPVRIVDIDDAALAAFGQWPWPRSRLAALVERLGQLGAAVVAFDVLFPEPDRASPARFAQGLAIEDQADAAALRTLAARLPDNDALFAQAMKREPVVLGFATEDRANARRPETKSGFAFAGADPKRELPPFPGATTNLPMLADAAAGVGALSLGGRENNGVVRRVRLLFTDGKHLYPSLALEALRVAQGARSIVVRSTGASGEAGAAPALVDLRVGQFRVPMTSQGELWLWYDHDRKTRYVSAKDVLDPARTAAVRPLLDGAIVFVGSSAAGLFDTRTTALGAVVPGVSIHAQAVEQIIAQRFVRRPDWATGLEILGTVVLGVALTALLLLGGARFAAIAGGLAGAAAIGGSWLAFRRFGLFVDPVYPLIGALATYLAVTGILRAVTDREKRFVRQAFGQYLAPQLLARLEASPDLLRLGGEMRPMTILFMDVRGFTPISERLSPEEVVSFLNRLMTPLSEAIQAELGTIDKYIGDSVMAFWNAPVAVPDHPRRACRAALAMRQALADLNASDGFGFVAAGRADLAVRIGVGVNTGEACVGNMGSDRRFNYSVIGDAVNTAARVESSCKDAGFDILVSEATAREVPGMALLPAGEIALKGKARPQALFALVGDETEAATPAFKAIAAAHAELMGALAAGRREAANAALERCRALGGEKLASLYDALGRRVAMLAEPQSADA